MSHSLRPRLRMPLWAAVAIAAAAYALRSALRGFDFRPDLPLDAIFAVLLALLIGLRIAFARAVDKDGPGPGGTGA